MMKRIIALLLALVLCLAMFSGCSKENEEDTAQTPAVIDYDAAFAKYDPETVVMTVNGNEVSWSEFYYMLYSAVYQLQYYLGDMAWDQECIEGYGTTFEEYSMQLTMDSIKQFHAIDKKAKDMGIALTDEDLTRIEETEESFKIQNCGEEATDEDFDGFLLENFYLTNDVYEFVNRNSVLYEKLFLESVGQNGEKVSDAEIQEFVERAPYVTAKHILVMTVNPETGEALSDEEIKQAKETAQQLLEQLQGIPNQKTLVSTFDALMQEYSEDTGLELFPNGYTFTTGQMYEVFEEAAFALEEYQVSEIVESEAGYHILLRLPTSRESLVDLDYETGVYYTIETYAMTDIYSRLISSWMDECEITWSKEFEGVTAEQIFA